MSVPSATKVSTIGVGRMFANLGRVLGLLAQTTVTPGGTSSITVTAGMLGTKSHAEHGVNGERRIR